MFEKMSVEQYCQSLASSSPTPGGGSALAFVGAIACSLVEMAASVTLAKPQTVNGDADYLTRELASITRARKCLYKLSDDDAEAYGNIVSARKLPKDTDEQSKRRTAEMQKAFHKATLVPLDVMNLCRDVLKRAETRVLPNLSKYIVSDCEIGISLLRTVIKYSIENVYANTVFIRDDKLKNSLETQARAIVDSL